MPTLQNSRTIAMLAVPLNMVFLGFLLSALVISTVCNADCTDSRVLFPIIILACHREFDETSDMPSTTQAFVRSSMLIIYTQKREKNTRISSRLIPPSDTVFLRRLKRPKRQRRIVTVVTKRMKMK
jgi:hypothetical protein